MKVWRQKIMSWQEFGRTEIRTGQKKSEATNFEVILEEEEVVAERYTVRNEETAVEIVGALEDRYWDNCPAIRRRRQPKTRSQADGGS
jgi:hypothetical protein